MSMNNLIEYSKSYSKTSGTLRSYYKDISIDPITNYESFPVQNKYYRKNS